MNHKPATPLPWVSTDLGLIISVDTPFCLGAVALLDDAAYIAHACNAYPELVEAVKWLREEYAKLPHSLGYTFTHLPKVDALLSKLGEDA